MKQIEIRPERFTGSIESGGHSFHEFIKWKLIDQLTNWPTFSTRFSVNLSHFFFEVYYLHVRFFIYSIIFGNYDRRYMIWNVRLRRYIIWNVRTLFHIIYLQIIIWNISVIFRSQSDEWLRFDAWLSCSQLFQHMDDRLLLKNVFFSFFYWHLGPIRIFHCSYHESWKFFGKSYFFINKRDNGMTVWVSSAHIPLTANVSATTWVHAANWIGWPEMELLRF